jgi:hypothetical protein
LAARARHAREAEHEGARPSGRRPEQEQGGHARVEDEHVEAGFHAMRSVGDGAGGGHRSRRRSTPAGAPGGAERMRKGCGRERHRRRKGLLRRPERRGKVEATRRLGRRPGRSSEEERARRAARVGVSSVRVREREDERGWREDWFAKRKRPGGFLQEGRAAAGGWTAKMPGRPVGVRVLGWEWAGWDAGPPAGPRRWPAGLCLGLAGGEVCPFFLNFKTVFFYYLLVVLKPSSK